MTKLRVNATCLFNDMMELLLLFRIQFVRILNHAISVYLNTVSSIGVTNNNYTSI